MELTHLQITWFEWIFISLLVLGTYLLLSLLNGAFEKASLLGNWQAKTSRILSRVFILSEPIGILIIIAAFILINPAIHGLIALISLVLCYNLIRSYVSGRVLLMNKELYTGLKIRFLDSEGFVRTIRRMGMSLQTTQGAKYIPYDRLLDVGFTQLEGEKIGGFRDLIIVSHQDETALDSNTLRDKLWESPYLDWSFEPEINITNEQHNFEVRVLLREASQIEHFVNLINEWGYGCRLNN